MRCTCFNRPRRRSLSIWRESDFRALIFPDFDLSQASILRLAKLNRTKLNGARLNGAILDQAWMIDADLSDANLTEASLLGTQMQRAKLDGADLSGARITGNLTGATMVLSRLVGVDASADMRNQSMGLMRGVLKSVNLKGADLRGANLSRTDLEFANLRNANLTDCNLVHAQLAGADLTGAILTNADFTAADLSFGYSPRRRGARRSAQPRSGRSIWIVRAACLENAATITRSECFHVPVDDDRKGEAKSNFRPPSMTTPKFAEDLRSSVTISPFSTHVCDRQQLTRQGTQSRARPPCVNRQSEPRACLPF